MSQTDPVGRPADAQASGSKPAKIALWSLGGLAVSLFGGVKIFELTPQIAINIPNFAAPSPAAPDQPLWDRLGLTVQDGADGPSIVKVEAPAKSAHLKPGMRIGAVAAGLLTDLNGKSSIVPSEPVASVAQAEGALRRAIAAGESKGLEQMRIELQTWVDGRLAGPLSFGIPLNKRLPDR